MGTGGEGKAKALGVGGLVGDGGELEVNPLVITGEGGNCGWEGSGGGALGVEVVAGAGKGSGEAEKDAGGGFGARLGLFGGGEGAAGNGLGVDGLVKCEVGGWGKWCLAEGSGSASAGAEGGTGEHCGW